MKTCPFNVYPLMPHFYIAKLGFAGVYIFFLFFTLEPEILYLAYLALEVTSPAIVGLNAFLASLNLP